MEEAAGRDRVLPVLAGHAAAARAAVDTAYPKVVDRRVGGDDNGAGWARRDGRRGPGIAGRHPQGSCPARMISRITPREDMLAS
ncbi:hypothetical protein BH23ACT9_BH23ACT9_00430 [soil metagenome]